MSPAATRLFKIGLALSIATGLASACAAVWAVTRSPAVMVGEGLPVGNKLLTAYRRGGDVRLATGPQMELFPHPAAVPNAHSRAVWARNARWGGPNHWLNVPVFDVSLWWPLALSGVFPGMWLARRRRHAAGFPVVANRRAT